MSEECKSDTWTESIDEETGQPRWDYHVGDVAVRAELDEDGTYEVIAYPEGLDEDSTTSLGPASDIGTCRERAVAYMVGRDDERHDRTSETVGEWGLDL